MMEREGESEVDAGANNMNTETVSSSVDTQKEKDKVAKLRRYAEKGEWSKVIQAYKQQSALRSVEISEKGDTVLHMAVSKGQDKTVAEMVNIIVKEKKKAQNDQVDKDIEKSSNVNATCILRAKNKKGNTPLHLAASKGTFEMCKRIVGADPSLITICNNASETPVLTAAFHCKKKAFIYLNDLYRKECGSSTAVAHYINEDKDTILHGAIAGGHIDLALDIVLLYEDCLKEMVKRNKNGLSPLHLLAATPSAFESNDLLGRSRVVQLLYRWILRVKEKEHATKTEELHRRGREREREPCINALAVAFMDKCECLSEEKEEGFLYMCKYIVFFLVVLPLFFLLVPPVLLQQSILSAGHWFHGIRKKKEKHAWSLQIMRKLVPLVSEEDMLAPSFEMDSEEAGCRIVDTPLMIAAKNGVTEMVEEILERFPSAMKVVNEEKKNIVLLAAEKRQTKLYQYLYKNLDDDTAFRQVDKDGNTALHLAAKLEINLNSQTTTMVEEFKWFEFVKRSVPYELWERYNKEWKTAEEIFRDSYKEHMTNDRKWLDQTSQTCSVASTLVAGMAFSNFAGENIEKKNDSSLVALSLSLTSTISFLAILAFRSQSLNFWKYVPFMLHIAILTMFGSIVALWISLMFHGNSITTCAILGSPIAILAIVSLPIFIGPTVMSIFNKVPPPDRNTTNAIQYRRPQKEENGVDKDQKPTQNPTGRAHDPIQDTTESLMPRSKQSVGLKVPRKKIIQVGKSSTNIHLEQLVERGLLYLFGSRRGNRKNGVGSSSSASKTEGFGKSGRQPKKVGKSCHQRTKKKVDGTDLKLTVTSPS